MPSCCLPQGSKSSGQGEAVLYEPRWTALTPMPQEAG